MIAVSDTTTAVYLPTPQPTVNVIDETGTTIASTAAAQAGVAAGRRVPRRRPGHLVDRRRVMVFDANGLQYKYTVAPAETHVPVGPATLMAGKLLVPVTGGFDVFDPVTGATSRTSRWTGRRAQSAVVPASRARRCSSSAATPLVALG